MKSRAYPDAICDISEADFWSQLKPVKDDEHAALLDRAVKLGRAGRKAAAYRALAAYHRAALAGVYEMYRDEAQARARRHRDGDRRLADGILRGRVVAWHSHVIRFRREIDWNFRDAGLSMFYGLHYLSWLRPLVAEVILSDRAPDRRAATRVVESYYAARNRLDWPWSHHPVYYELGANSKTHVLLPLYLALIQRSDVRPATVEAMMKLFVGFARSLRKLQRSYRPGNWQIVGCGSLFVLSRIFPELAGSDAWRRTAVRYLLQHLEEDFFSDGGHCERAWGYGFMSLRGYLQAARIDGLRGGLGRRRAMFLRKIRQAFRWFARTLGPGEIHPAYGDDTLGNTVGILDAARPFFPKDTPRDLGVDRGVSSLLRPSGFAIMRNGRDAAYLNATFGRYQGFHSHFDVLNMNFWAFGRPLVEECGRFDAYDNPVDALLRTPPYHNVVTVDGQRMDDTDPTDLRGRDVAWHSDTAADYCSAWHKAYKEMPLLSHSIDAIVRRTIVFVKDPGYAFVLDSVCDRAGQRPGFALTQHWHSPWRLRATGPQSVRTCGSPGMLIAFAREDGLHRLEAGVDFAGEEVTSKGDCPDRYHLRARRWMPIGWSGATGFATLLLPFKGRLPEATIRPLPRGEPWRAEGYEVRTPAGRDVIVLNPERLSDFRWRGRAFGLRARITLGAGRGTVAVP